MNKKFSSKIEASEDKACQKKTKAWDDLTDVPKTAILNVAVYCNPQYGVNDMEPKICAAYDAHRRIRECAEGKNSASCEKLPSNTPRTS
mmetsp:Transcript_15596/g.15787  ORF Transcript_15596/g.15787 Transcript_15596/m.15787 type:complete len:89 (+) Transcript_15596:716-982(+)